MNILLDSYLSNCLRYQTNNYFLFRAQKFDCSHLKNLKKIRVLNNLSDSGPEIKDIKNYVASRKYHVIKSDDNGLYAILDDENELVLERFAVQQAMRVFITIDGRLAFLLRYPFYANELLGNRDLPEKELKLRAKESYIKNFLGLDSSNLPDYINYRALDALFDSV